jgi:hypothetical protein
MAVVKDWLLDEQIWVVFGVEMRVEQKEREGSGRVLRHNLEMCPHFYNPGSCAKGFVDKSFRDAADSVLCLEPKDR